jgi:hypothetical protein
MPVVCRGIRDCSAQLRWSERLSCCLSGREGSRQAGHFKYVALDSLRLHATGLPNSYAAIGARRTHRTGATHLIQK